MVERVLREKIYFFIPSPYEFYQKANDNQIRFAEANEFVTLWLNPDNCELGYAELIKTRCFLKKIDTANFLIRQLLPILGSMLKTVTARF